MEARRIAFEILLEVVTEEAYSNVALSAALDAQEISAADKGLITEIVYGTLTHYKLLKFWLKPYFQGRVKEWVKVLLAMTLYQIIYLEKVPDYAAVDEAVKLAKGRGGDFNAKAVNAILRKVTTNELRDTDEMEAGPNRIAVETSHPTWLVRLWMAQFGEEKTKAMLTANNQRPKLAIRANATKTTRDDLQKRLQSEGVQTALSEIIPTALTVTSGNPLTTQSFKAGLFYIQDESSMLPALALAPTSGSKVLDVCAAPGGKTFHLAEMTGPKGVVYAHDIYDHKIARIEENAKRLEINNVEASLCNALALAEQYEPESFDYILVDAPCSGLGILRRHPEAKITKRPEDLDAITDIQKQILISASKLLKPTGRLVYSTCTVNRKENQRQVEGFLNEHQDFTFDTAFEARMPSALKKHFEHEMLQLFPQDFGTDGFFVASLVKK
ncbi:MAG: 16S rRNA (cytosine(967)-C(5))-methyltransferase RsmB [Turicibacter sp.]|nr:16S rRNA (cytosine(967)-C(5))-methyltransferase RsmB [Turicibacter sp.]